MSSGPDLGRVKPPWFKVRVPGGADYVRVRQTLRELELETVCEQARCPNLGQCWGSGTATFLLLGPSCTRSCRFCHVEPGRPAAPRPDEPERVAEAAKRLGLPYVVLTMVTRDDLDDGGARHMARAIATLRSSGRRVEALVGDFGGSLEQVTTVVSAEPDVFAHNLEVTRRLTPLVRDPRSSYDLSLEVLRHARAHLRRGVVKSSLMVGLGETPDEVLEALADLRRVGVDMVTIGQYACPSRSHLPVARWVDPAEFASYAQAAHRLGFSSVACGPLVRSSYRAREAWAELDRP